VSAIAAQTGPGGASKRQIQLRSAIDALAFLAGLVPAQAAEAAS
jgi:hypothetical protein